MSSLLLTEQERDRFASWLEHEAATSKGLIEQLEKLGPAMTMMIPHQKAEVAAALLIARRLRATHSDSIGGGGGMSTDTTRAAMQAALEWLKKLPDTDPLWPYFVNGRFRADMDDAIAAIEAAIEAAQPQQAEASPATLTERDHFDLALWHKKLGELADAYYEAGRTHPARQRARAALMLHALDCATGWRARSAKPQQAEPVTVEAVAEVVRTEDGLDLSWLVEGGICAMEDGVVLLMSHRPITDDFGHGEVYTAPPAHSAQPQQAEPENPWRAVIDEALIASCLDCIGADEAPVAALARLVRWEVQIALDPAVSSPAAALVQRGRDDATPQQAEPAAEGREPAP